MCSKWIKCGFVLATLLISMVSLSMAACPWFIKNDLYSAQCGVEKLVPASAGLLANDPGAVAVLDPDDITIDAKYGTLDVKADGSFVFDPSPDIQSGTYVQFKYNATNGACTARVPGIAKIQVSCKCRPQVRNITICLPTTLAEIREKLIEAGVDCLGCGDITTGIDLNLVELSPGTWPFFVKCPGCQNALGWVTLVPGCTAVAPDLEFCGPVTLAQVLAGINAGADCTGTGCDQAPVIDTSGLIVVDGFVTGGSYTATCGAGSECANTDTGTVTVFQKCDVAAPPIEICEGTTLAGLLEEIDEVADCTGADCDATPAIDTTNVDVEDGFVTGGSYTVTCTVAPNCASSASGVITVVPKCEVELIGVTVGCITPEDLEEQIKTSDNPTPCGDCDSSPVFEFPVWPLRADGSGFIADGLYTYTVTCNAGGLEGCDSSGIGEVNVTGCQPPCPCVAMAEPIEICPNKVKIPALKAMILDGNATCSGEGGSCDITPAIDTTGVTVDANGFVTGGSYTATCQTNPGCLPVVATATVTVVDAPECHPCTCEANAPDICVPYICDYHSCHLYSLSEITSKITANGGGCSTGCTMTLKFYNQYGTETSFSNLHWNGVYHYTYKVICTKGDCGTAQDTGKLDVLKLADCPCNTCGS